MNEHGERKEAGIGLDCGHSNQQPRIVLRARKRSVPGVWTSFVTLYTHGPLSEALAPHLSVWEVAAAFISILPSALVCSLMLALVTVLLPLDCFPLWVDISLAWLSAPLLACIPRYAPWIPSYLYAPQLLASSISV